MTRADERGLRLELTETGEGWILTLHADAETAAALGDVPALVNADADRRPEISVRPNLVPGEPIPLSVVRIVVGDGSDTEA